MMNTVALAVSSCQITSLYWRFPLTNASLHSALTIRSPPSHNAIKLPVSSSCNIAPAEAFIRKFKSTSLNHCMIVTASVGGVLGPKINGISTLALA